MTMTGDPAAHAFPLYTDTDIDGPVVKALRAAAWDILRGIDAYPEKTRDHVHFAPNGSAMLALGSNCTSDA